MSDAERLVELIPRLRRYARALVGDRASADDLVQDTLERAWAKLHLYSRGTDLRAWLFTVMHNVHVNKLRASRATDPLEDEMPELAQRAPQGDALLVRDLERAIGGLPSEERAARRRWRWRTAAAAAGLVALGGLIGVLGDRALHEWRAPAPAPEAASFVRRAVVAHATYAPEVRHPVEVGADQEAHLVSWLSQRLGAPVRAPKRGGGGARPP